MGTRHDAFILNQSTVLKKMEANMNSVSGDPYCLYGDPVYGMSAHLNGPFHESSSGPLTPNMMEFNNRMSAACVTVEWGFQEMTSKWASLCMKPQQKVLLGSVGVQYKVATLLSS